MSEIVDGLGSDSRERIAALRRERALLLDRHSSRRGPLAEASRRRWASPSDALGPLLDFDESTPPSRKFHADGDHVVFTMSCFLEAGGTDGDGVHGSCCRVEVHVLVSGSYIRRCRSR